jgi:hypothetical protein
MIPCDGEEDSREDDGRLGGEKDIWDKFNGLELCEIEEGGMGRWGGTVTPAESLGGEREGPP